MNKPPMTYAEVALPLPVDHLFTYEVPESLRDRVQVGMRAVLPVGKRIETGYVVGLSDDTDRDDVRRLFDLPDEGPVFDASMLELCRWVADYYCCSLGEALQCALPAGLKMRSRMRYTLLHDRLGPGRYTERQRKVIAELYRRGTLTEGQLARAVGGTALSNTLQSLVRRGIVEGKPVLGEAGVSMRTETWVRLVEDSVPGTAALIEMQRKAPKQAAVYMDLLHGKPERRCASLYEKHKVNSQIVAALEQKGLLQRFEREMLRAPASTPDPGAAVKPVLNEHQQAAYDEITNAVENNEFKTFLIPGITGSGKTEVYLQVIEFVLEQGRDAIVLVPEISLTPQTVGRFCARFGERIAVLHSGLGKGERYDEWRRARRGDVRIVVGARSAIFAPLANLGVIVVDEEHDTSYKQGESPRYHARDVAIMRAKLMNAVCVLGSATPSAESYYNSRRGKFIRLDLPERAAAESLPEVEVVDMRTEPKTDDDKAILSKKLEEEVNKRVGVGEQVILLLNRRGFAPFVLCPKCGWVAECADCNVSMTYHSRDASLRCHYCDARRPKPAACEHCGFKSPVYLGTGTQKVEELLLRSFDHCRIERMDADTTAGKGGHAKILGRFAEGDIDILIGTQMVAKGHDYPGVTLVGVINADAGLNIPDFRAAENTCQLLTQVAGRAGRGKRPGKVIVQTYRPNHYVLEAVKKHDYAAFFERELAERKAAGFPPLRRMGNFSVECEDQRLARQSVELLHKIVREQIDILEFRGVETLGPAPAVIARVKKKYRWNLAILSKSATRVNTLTRSARNKFNETRPTGRVQLKIDLDPYNTF